MKITERNLEEAGVNPQHGVGWWESEWIRRKSERGWSIAGGSWKVDWGLLPGITSVYWARKTPKCFTSLLVFLFLLSLSTCFHLCLLLYVFKCQQCLCGTNGTVDCFVFPSVICSCAWLWVGVCGSLSLYFFFVLLLVCNERVHQKIMFLSNPVYLVSV